MGNKAPAKKAKKAKKAAKKTPSALDLALQILDRASKNQVVAQSLRVDWTNSKQIDVSYDDEVVYFDAGDKKRKIEHVTETIKL